MFEIRVNGETVFKTESQVTGVALQSARGELYKAGISTEGVIDVVLDTVRAGDPVRLDQIESAQRRANAALVEGLATGPVVNEPGDRTMTAQQVIGDVTLHPGDENTVPQGEHHVPPSVDLASGLDPSDTDTLSARVDAFNEHGDAERAVRDYPPESGQPAAVVTDMPSGSSDYGSTGEVNSEPATGNGFNLGEANTQQEPNPNEPS